ncbi:uncharacterized protein LOC141630869 [Silene latifolia]|uniref:uncharacterized protein LOC141630869 n=1 Tax=Silene latifolia TaxID=37657 RepID=UPI003D76F36A
MRWIKNSLEPDIAATFQYATSSRELWSELIERYGQTNAVEIYQYKKELGKICQENSSLIEYYSKMKHSWDCVDSFDPIPYCNCGAMDRCSCQLLKRLLERDNVNKLIQFLMGLNNGYETAKTTVLTMEPLPPLNKALGLLQKIERQKQLTETAGIPTEATAYAAGRTTDVQQGDCKREKQDAPVVERKFCTHCKRGGHNVESCFHLQTCESCGKKGHIAAHCFLKLKFAEQQRSTTNKQYKGKNKFQSRGRSNVYQRGANNADVVSSNNPLDVVNADATQADQRMVIDKSVMDGIMENVRQQVIKAMTDYSVPGSFSVHFAGTDLYSEAAFYVVQTYDQLSWIVDTGASDHMTSRIDLLHNVRFLVRPVMVGLPDGTIKLVHKVGDIILTSAIQLKDVLVVPDFKRNLLSVSKLIQHTPMIVLFTSEYCAFQDLTKKRVLGLAKRQRYLYWFEPALKNKAAQSSIKDKGALTNKDFLSSSNACNKLCSFEVFHSTLGHSSYDQLKHVKPLSMDAITKFSAETCHLSKLYMLPFQRSTSYASALFDLVHLDLWGPYKTSTLLGAKYFLTVLDDHFRVTWIYMFQNKHQVPGLLKAFITYVATQFERKIKVFRSDNGTEFFQEYCANLFTQYGILHQRSIVGRPQQNGHVERKHRHLIETARALKIRANLPSKFWGECVLTATYLINKMPSSVLNW